MEENIHRAKVCESFSASKLRRQVASQPQIVLKALAYHRGVLLIPQRDAFAEREHIHPAEVTRIDGEVVIGKQFVHLCLKTIVVARFQITHFDQHVIDHTQKGSVVYSSHR